MGYLLLRGNCRRGIPLADGSVHCCITSPPYWGLRDYQTPGQIGLEESPSAYVARMVEVFREVRRVLHPSGVVFLNLGDSYNSAASNQNGGGTALGGYVRGGNLERGRNSSICRDGGLKPKDLVGIPWAVAFALRDDGWWLRSDIIWSKPNPMPESVTDRPTKAHEYLFLLTKRPDYFYDQEAIREPNLTISNVRNKSEEVYGYMARLTPEGKGIREWNNSAGRNKRSVWTVNPHPFPGAHFATFPPKLIEPCVLAGTSQRGCCPRCGGPWERVVERGEVPMTSRREHLSASQWEGHPDFKRKVRPSSLGAGCGGDVPTREIKTLGWQPSCSCLPADPIPCTVLDIFNGSGTTGVVALAHGRRYVGLDLNPEYLEMAKKRIERPHAPRVCPPSTQRDLPGQRYLFDELTEIEEVTS
jgi:DNA modification methylase